MSKTMVLQTLVYLANEENLHWGTLHRVAGLLLGSRMRDVFCAETAEWQIEKQTIVEDSSDAHRHY